ncbi:sensor histidine kinase [Paenibacillus arenilitoris]|uniref:Sensor histidine kinase n=1 Tax=Paenibacillus arenilitoris TaxID=2772299 RepID=A0A927CS28_9BACL|nr:sensor histidine kinase [Paenibacillus arenilitoris]MBD2870881.1 sensor histidine kinase [Paenibacillus arenilitoris]
MRLGSLYGKYIKNNLFMKIILLFALITIVTIITFSYLMYLSMSQSALQRQLDVQRRAMESVSGYIGGKYESVQTMMVNVYRDEELAFNLSYLMENPYPEYVEHRLDKYYNDNSTSTDVVQFFRNRLDDDRDIRSLMLYSAELQQLYTFNDARQFKIVSANAANSFIPDAMYLEEDSNVSIPNVWVKKAIDLEDQPLFSVRVPVNNKQSLRNIGQLLVYFESNELMENLARFEEKIMGSIVVLSADGDVIFDSSGRGYGGKYPYFEQVSASLSDGEVADNFIMNKSMHTQGGFTVLSMVPKAELEASYVGLRRTIVTISSICIFFTILIPSLFIGNFAKRTHNIIRFTRKVKQGDLSARIEDVKEDELGQISKSFNDMLEELNQYIDRVYKAEIKQKHTELAALEARVNPHFLYNTLEVIRMRAVSQGAGDVGEMIYSLSVLFKSYVQQKPNYTLQDELEACRLYLELFRIRYKDKFAYDIRCEPGLKGKAALKMSLQPVIENYILHGLRTDRHDNRIEIAVRKDGDLIRAEVTDNGKGIEPGRMEEIRRGLDDPDANAESFGLRSIHERLRLLYGPGYGIEIESTPEEGTTVTVLYPDIGEA